MKFTGYFLPKKNLYSAITPYSLKVFLLEKKIPKNYFIVNNCFCFNTTPTTTTKNIQEILKKNKILHFNK